jgi:S1-C subfamily serine protease
MMFAGSLVICLLALAVLTMPGGPLEGQISLPKLEMDAPLRVSVQTAPTAEVGEETQMVVIVQNQGETSIQISEIQLPMELLQVAVVLDVTPGTLFQTHNQDNTAFKIDWPLPAGTRQAFIFTLLPKIPADISGQAKVLANSTQAASDFRLSLVHPVAEIIPTNTPTATASHTPTQTPLPPTLTPTPRMTIPYQAVVQITAKVKHSSLLRIAWTGSGTIISPDGLILTNAHLVLGPPGSKVDYFIISVTLEPEDPPVASFIAEDVYVDKGLDLALLRVTTDLKYKEVDPSNLNLISVPLGDSDQLEIGDTLTILGYPGIGGETITLTRGAVGGFTAETKYGERAFIKTATNITGGTSGGMALDQYGRMVAIPTQLGSGAEENWVNCELVADTNEDNEVNQRDQCLPAGGFINALRPINLAFPMIQKFKNIEPVPIDTLRAPTSGSP